MMKNEYILVGFVIFISLWYVLDKIVESKFFKNKKKKDSKIVDKLD